jgi:hypothetical protein
MSICFHVILHVILRGWLHVRTGWHVILSLLYSTAVSCCTVWTSCGVPVSPIAEAYIQNMEYQHVYLILMKSHIIEYFWYVHWHSANLWPKKNVDKTLAELNEQTTINCTVEKESCYSINFLNFSIHHSEGDQIYNVNKAQWGIKLPSDSCLSTN